MFESIILVFGGVVEEAWAVERLAAPVLGVATVSYASFTFFKILNPLIWILFGFAEIRMLKLQPGMPVSS